MTLAKLGYEPYRDNDKELAYRIIIGDTDIVLSIDKETKQVKKTANDFIKLVEIEPDEIEIMLIENAFNKKG